MVCCFLLLLLNLGNCGLVDGSYIVLCVWWMRFVLVCGLLLRVCWFGFCGVCVGGLLGFVGLG